jgi:hypothetical protein
LLRKVGVTEHEQETCVEEDADEYTVGDEAHLSRLSVAANRINNDNDDHPDKGVQDNDEVLDQVVPNQDLPSSLLVALAKLLLVGIVVYICNIVYAFILPVDDPLFVTFGLGLTVAEALKGAI